MVWYSHLLKNFPQFVVMHTVKGFGIVNKAEIDVFLSFTQQIFDLLCDWVCAHLGYSDINRKDMIPPLVELTV